MAEMLVQCKVLGSVELEFEVTVVSLADVESGNLTMKNLRELVGKQLEEHDQHNDFRMICNGKYLEDEQALDELGDKRKVFVVLTESRVGAGEGEGAVSFKRVVSNNISCPFEGCEQRFPDKEALQLHINLTPSHSKLRDDAGVVGTFASFARQVSNLGRNKAMDLSGQGSVELPELRAREVDPDEQLARQYRGASQRRLNCSKNQLAFFGCCGGYVLSSLVLGTLCWTSCQAYSNYGQGAGFGVAAAWTVVIIIVAILSLSRNFNSEKLSFNLLLAFWATMLTILWLSASVSGKSLRYSRVFSEETTEVFGIDPAEPIPSDVSSALTLQFDPSKYKIEGDRARWMYPLSEDCDSGQCGAQCVAPIVSSQVATPLVRYFFVSDTCGADCQCDDLIEIYKSTKFSTGIRVKATLGEDSELSGLYDDGYLEGSYVAAMHSRILSASSSTNFTFGSMAETEFVSLEYEDKQGIVSSYFVGAWAVSLSLVFGWPLVMLLIIVCAASQGS